MSIWRKKKKNTNGFLSKYTISYFTNLTFKEMTRLWMKISIQADAFFSDMTDSYSLKITNCYVQTCSIKPVKACSIIKSCWAQVNMQAWNSTWLCWSQSQLCLQSFLIHSALFNRVILFLHLYITLTYHVEETSELLCSIWYHKGSCFILGCFNSGNTTD